MPTKTPIALSLAGISIAALFLTACTPGSTGEREDEEREDSAEQSEIHWSYEHDGGPGAWSALSSDYDSCSSGAHQSPIDLPSDMPALSGEIEMTTKAVPIVEADTGHASQVGVASHASTVHAGGEEYELLQIHAHTPAEHTVDGVAPAAEMHMVHSSEDGELLVVSVLADEGPASLSWQTFLDTATGPDDASATLDVASLLPSSMRHWSYDGSLTTPPCTEGVTWVVFSEPITLSSAQINDLKAAHDANARPTQPSSDREIRSGTATLAKQAG